MNVAVVAFCLGMSAQAIEAHFIAPELEKLQGKWIVESFIDAGSKDPLEVGKCMIIRGKEATTIGNLKCALRINPFQDPKTYDLTFFDKNKNQQRVIRGIYKLDGDVLTLCYGTSLRKNVRPAEFRSDGSNLARLVVYRREKLDTGK